MPAKAGISFLWILSVTYGSFQDDKKKVYSPKEAYP